MPSFNQVNLIGNLCRDVELKYTPKGTAIGNFSLAVNRKWKTDDGETKEEVSFIDCVAFAKSAETLAQYVKKGSPIFLTGRLRQETWDDKTTGKKRSKLGVVVEGFQFLSSKLEGSAQAASRPNPSPTGTKLDTSDADLLPQQEGDVPF